MPLPDALVEYLGRSPDAAVILAADGTEVWRNSRVTDEILDEMAYRFGTPFPRECEGAVGSRSIVVVPVGDVFVATVREVAGLGRDPLTALVDRTVFATHVEQAVAAAQRGRTAALLYFDLDGLKRVNDTRGHREGDRYLVRFADELRAAVRAEDVVARLGGDEFAILIRNVTSADAPTLAGAVHDRLASPASVGVAIVDGSESADDALARADTACYAAKASGGDRVEFSPGTADSSGGAC